jgi:hypothetical protein
MAQESALLNQLQFYLQKQNKFKVEFDGGKTKVFQRQPLSSKRIREIQNLQDITESSPAGTRLLSVYRLCANYCLNITNDIEFESAIWQDDPDLTQTQQIFGLKSVLDACLLRSTHGIAYYAPELEEWIVYDSSKALLSISNEVSEAWNMWVNKQYGIMPHQYHHFYEQGDTLIYPEHIADIITIDKMWNEKLKKERQKEEQKQKGVKNSPLTDKSKAGGGLGGFYGQTMKFNNNK